MKVHALNLVSGTSICNARCPFCISKMTPKNGISMKEPCINLRNLKKACALSKMSNASTVKITGKGEPLLFPKQITKYLRAIGKFEFPLIELQTNGILLWEQKEKYKPYLQEWYRLGLNTIIISIVHYDGEKNRQVFLPHKKSYVELPKLIAYLHNMGFSIRLGCILASGLIDNKQEIERIVSFARQNNVEQLTLIPVNKPKNSEDMAVAQWVEAHQLGMEAQKEIMDFLAKEGHELMRLSHGAIIYDVDGQNVCIAGCLTLPKKGEFRHLIFFPDGHIAYDWQYKGGVLV